MGERNREVKPFVVDTPGPKLKVIDQLLLPAKLEFVEIENTQDGVRVIKNMQVRGAPCIAAVGCLSIIVELNKIQLKSVAELIKWLDDQSELLIAARPTAVNLQHALDKLVTFAKMKLTDLHQQESSSVQILVEALTGYCLDAIDAGYDCNVQLGDYGYKHVIENAKERPAAKLNVLTHCNTGSLATVGYGTALGVVRSMHAACRVNRVYCTETRPYNQGSRLTAWELAYENIPATLIADNMVAFLMATKQIDCVVVGADRVAANGDTANKIGTLQIAVVAKHYNVPFYVAAPTQTLDLKTRSGEEITIEQRPSNEMRFVGNTRLAPDEVDVWNPCFDVTPAKLIAAVITEYGVCDPSSIGAFLSKCDRREPHSKGALF